MNRANSNQPSKTVLLIGNFLSHAGASRSVSEDLAVHLRELGWQLITTSHKLERIPRLFDILATIWQQRLEYQAAHIDIYSGPAFIWAEASGWLLSTLQKPFIVSLHGGNLPQFADRWPGRVRRLLHSASTVTTPSRYLFETMQSYCQDIRLLPNAINLDNYKFRLRNNPRPHLIWLRAFHKVYNPTLAVRVLANFSSDFPDACLTMIGPDREDGSLGATKNVAKELGVLERIEITGGVPKADVPKWMNKGDIFLNTSNVDNTPVCILEAMACGLCVVSTDVGGVPYLVEHGKDALLSPPENVEVSAAAIRKLLCHPHLAARISKNARAKAEEFDWNVILPQWMALFADIISK